MHCSTRQDVSRAQEKITAERWLSGFIPASNAPLVMFTMRIRQRGINCDAFRNLFYF